MVQTQMGYLVPGSTPLYAANTSPSTSTATSSNNNYATQAAQANSISGLNPTEQAMFSLGQGIQQNNAAYQRGMNNEQTSYIGSMSNTISGTNSTMSNQGKK